MHDRPLHTTSRAIAIAALAATLWTTSARPATAQDAANAVDRARAAIAELVETRRILSAETRDAALGREMLRNRIALLEREVAAMRGRITEAEQSLAEIERKRGELTGEAAGVDGAHAVLEEALPRLETRTRALLARLPEAARERVAAFGQRIPEDPSASRASTQQRFQAVIGVLTGLDKFQREITVTSELRPLADGRTAEATVLYVGLGHAWWVASNGAAGGTGTATDAGWVWREVREAATDIARAIAIQQGQEPPAFVRLPMVTR